ncbi:hypothetical protein Droror1_Dr00025194 [Drosera rotundifolia]
MELIAIKSFKPNGDSKAEVKKPDRDGSSSDDDNDNDESFTVDWRAQHLRKEVKEEVSRAWGGDSEAEFFMSQGGFGGCVREEMSAKEENGLLLEKEEMPAKSR